MCLTIVNLADSWPWQLEPESVELEHMICSAVINSASLLMRLMVSCEQDSTGDDMTAG